jgi:hypothetical protein
MSKQSNTPSVLALSAAASTARDKAAPDRRTTPLRRWSVAELIARAVAPRPIDGMSH